MPEVLFVEGDSPVPVRAAQGEPFADPCDVLSSEALFNKVGGFDSEAEKQQGQVQQDLPCRHIFIDEIYAVPRCILHFEVIIL